MIKYWNNNPAHGEKPVKPSFLIKVMALECLHGGWGGRFDREILFATLADGIGDVWNDPAGLGPPISSEMDAQRVERARGLLQAASRKASLAIVHELHLLTTPTLLMVGTRDRTAPGRAFAAPKDREVMGRIAERAQELAPKMANAKVEVFDGVGHLIHLEQPQRFHTVVERFLAGREAGASWAMA